MKSVFLLYMVACVFVSNSYAQKNATVNCTSILPTDDSVTIIKKAANIKPSARQLRWQQLELTAFFHFGINTFTNKEWGNGKEDPKLFNPTAFNAEQWVITAKNGGIKQVILTAKHHDGFCLWPTKTTQHSVISSPWLNGKGDVVKAVAEACKKHHIGFGIYLSPWDRNSPLYGTEAYNNFFVQQLTELLTQYGKVDEVWFDGANGEGPNGKKQVYDFNRWYKIIRKLQPDAVIAIMGPDVRWVGTETGYGRNTEWSVVPINNLNTKEISQNSQQNVAFKPDGDMTEQDLGSNSKIIKAKGLAWYPAEVDVSIRPGWFYHSNEDSKVKSKEKLLDIYFNSVGKNGLLLLNIPPDTRGLVHKTDSTHLSNFNQLIKQIFSNNLLNKAHGISPQLIDQKLSSFVTTKTQHNLALNFNFNQNITTNLLSLQENIALGQSVQSFTLQALQNNQWVTITTGTTIGYKRIISFNSTTAKAFKLFINARTQPKIAHAGLYYYNP